MAWRSSGTTNDEMVTNLKNNGVIHTQAVEEGFRGVDRRFFVPRNRQEVAHSDQPLKEGNVHISAPHIYGTVIEALELTPNSSLSFLNIGSGTGYLTCIVAEILGPTSTHYGVEIHEDVVEHCRQSLEAWKAERASASSVPQIEIISGNGLLIDNLKGESQIGLDRIYIGAAVEKRNLGQLASLLKPGGVLVGPVGDELVKVVRIGDPEAFPSPPPPRSFRGQAPALSGAYSQQVISGVRFAPLVEQPAVPVILPSRVWSPSVHSYYPPSFRKACKEILLCSRAPSVQHPPPQEQNRCCNMAASLPRALWMEVLSYTRRDWFEQPQSEEDFLRKRLREEQAAAQRAQEARIEAESRLHVVERERDIYRLLALRWQRRLQATMNERGEGGAAAGDDDLFSGIDDVAAAAVFAGDEPLVVRLGGLGAMIRRFQRDSDDEEEEDGEDTDGAEENNGQADMEDDETVMSEDGDAMEATNHDTEPMSVSPEAAEAVIDSVRPQARTVSITGEDL